MAKARPQLIQALRETARQIERGDGYHWAHAGKCNCGHLAQVITGLSPSEIFQCAQQHELTEWSEYANDYCPSSGLPIDEIISRMMAAGLDRRDLHRLEYLSDVRVLMALPGGMRYLRRNQPADVALYLRTWAGLLEAEYRSTRKRRAATEPDYYPSHGFYLA
ncbi:hypothetical protein [Ruficoccus sp. ZRK36]|uniref:hypothetical protein n=1 Tax=Ruficoccus sp. ZRK36 TaxID=2866311 RepID=UPI001C72AF7E|nr:hypothetical protein [Ruficoccus sp. ZRK36]QYY36646.1 hypothetical protein K0V07_04030 [Ruficoccus sp. ZRK36]